MDGHDWSHADFGHDDPGHDALDDHLPGDGLPEPDEHGLQHDSDWLAHHDAEPLEHPFAEAGEPAAEDALPAEQIFLEPEPVVDAPIVPADGLDWIDPDLLGHAPLPPEPWAAPEELLDTLHHAAGAETGDWDTMAGSDDPAVRALAELWRPEQA